MRRKAVAKAFVYATIPLAMLVSSCVIQYESPQHAAPLKLSITSFRLTDRYRLQSRSLRRYIHVDAAYEAENISEANEDYFSNAKHISMFDTFLRNAVLKQLNHDLPTSQTTIHIVSDVPTSVLRAKDFFFVDMADMLWCESNLALKKGWDIYPIDGIVTSTDDCDSWIPMNEKTYPDWFMRLDKQLRISDVLLGK